MKWISLKKEKNIKKKNLFYFLLSALMLGLVLFLGISYSMGEDKWRIISAIPSPMRKAGRITLRFLTDLPYIKYEFTSHELPVYDLQISRENLAFLESTIPKDPSAPFLSEDREYVKAKFVADGKEYNVEVSYRGVMRNHWLWPKKSYRINFLDEQRFKGKQSLNFIVPIDRLYLNAENNHFRAKQLGLTVGDTNFSVLKINGKQPAVYWVSEQFGKDFLETKELISDANLYGEVGVDDEIYTSIEKWKKYNEDARFHKDNYVELEKLLDLLNNSSDEEFNKNIFSILDEDNFYNWSTHNAVVFGQHQDWGHNIRLYFDSSIGKFKIMPWDVGLYEMEQNKYFIDSNSNPLANRILSNAEFMRKRNERLWAYIKPGGPVEAEFVHIDKLYEQTKVAFYQDKIRRFNNKYFDDEVRRYKGILVNNVNYLRGFFAGKEFNVNALNKGGLSEIILETRSLSPLSIESILLQDFTDKVELKMNDRIIICRFVENNQNLNKFLCAENNIYSNILKKDIPPTESTKAGTEKYYKAFELIKTKTHISLVSSPSNLVLQIRNNYTGEIFSVNIEQYDK